MALAVAVFAVGPATVARAETAPTARSWRISNARVVRPARAVVAGQGRMWVGYEIEADAVSLGQAPRERATFRIVVSAHSPARDMPGQKAGRWYVRGSWSLASVASPSPARQAWLGPHVIRGELAVELDFNPLERSGAVKASVRSSGVEEAGAFEGSEKFEGVLRLPIRPAAPAPRRGR